MAFINIESYYFDQSDYKDPIKPYMEDKLYFNLAPGYMKSAVIYLVHTAVQTFDNLFMSTFGGNSYEYYNIDRVKPDISIEGSNGVLFSASIRLDAQQTQITRKVYTFFDMISNIGGFFEIMCRIFMIFVTVY